MVNRYFQFPKAAVAARAMKGPQKEDTAFTTCPPVRQLVRRSPFTTFVRSGFRDTCRRVLPMPSRTNATMQETKV